MRGRAGWLRGDGGDTLARVATPALFDARSYLQGLVGQTIPTITGKPNTILAVRDDEVFVRTQAATNPAVGEPVPIQWVQDAGDTLYANGTIGINTTEATHRSAFIGAVLSTLPGAVGLRRPARVELVARGDASALPELEVGRVYTWEELADAFGFKPAFFSAAGGMVPSAATNSLLLITHPGGGKSFDYEDHWDGADLIYTGRGKVGNQQRGDARNLDVAENRRPLFVFEAAGPRRLLFRGRAVNVEERTGRAPDDEGAMRDVLLFRLRFETTTAAAPAPEDAGSHGRRGEGGAADVHGAAILSLEPGDLGDRVAGDQAGVPVDRAGRRGEHHLRHGPPAAGELDLRRCGARLLVGGWPVGAHRLPQFAPVQRQARRPHPVGPPLEQLVARHAPAEVVAGRGDVAVQAQVHAEGQFPHGVSLP